MRYSTILALLALLAVLCGSAAMAQQPSPPSGPGEMTASTLFTSQFGPIEAMAPVPAPGFSVLQVDGKLFLVSTNMKYAIIPAKMLDLWNNMEIKTVEDMKASRRIPFKKMLGSRADGLGGVQIGKEGAPEVIVWLDGYGKETAAIIPAIRENLGRYRFRLIWLPVDKATADQNRALVCAPALAARYVTTGRVEGKELQEALCSSPALQNNLMAAMMLGINKVPTTIAPNGVPLIGVGDGYTAFLQANEQ